MHGDEAAISDYRDDPGAFATASLASEMQRVDSYARRRCVEALFAGAALAACRASRAAVRKASVFTVVTLGDSILDCARYNEYGVHPGQLIVRNEDRMFPDFKGR